MDRKQFNIFLVCCAGGIVILVGLIGFINDSVQKHLNQKVQETALKKEEAAVIPFKNISKKIVESDVVPEMKSSDLTPYQITPQRQSNAFKNQQFWDVSTGNAVKRLGLFNEQSRQGTFQGIKMSPAE